MNKTALVTGASSGIGKAISEMLVNEGYTVYGIGRCFKDTKSLPGFIPLVCDLTDEKQLKETLSRIPGKELDVLVKACIEISLGGSHVIRNLQTGNSRLTT